MLASNSNLNFKSLFIYQKAIEKKFTVVINEWKAFRGFWEQGTKFCMKEK